MLVLGDAGRSNQGVTLLLVAGSHASTRGKVAKMCHKSASQASPSGYSLIETLCPASPRSASPSRSSRSAQIAHKVWPRRNHSVERRNFEEEQARRAHLDAGSPSALALDSRLSALDCITTGQGPLRWSFVPASIPIVLGFCGPCRKRHLCRPRECTESCPYHQTNGNAISVVWNV